MLLATKTLHAIEKSLRQDQGAKFRGHLEELMPLAGDAYSTKEDPWRDHLGASVIGKGCGREIWYSFRWATKPHFSGRMLRLFNRGHLEEPRFLALLRMLGCEVWQIDRNGKQFRISGVNGHFGGSLDGVVRGIPDLPDTPILTEFKTHGEKSFNSLKANGVMSSKREHYIQMQLYMGKQRLPWALYAAVNKNTDELHLELIPFDEECYEHYLIRAALVIESSEPLSKISLDPAWFKCKFCDHKGICHGEDFPVRNCRTCVYSSPSTEASWMCSKNGGEVISPSKQRIGCDNYTLNTAFKNKV